MYKYSPFQIKNGENIINETVKSEDVIKKIIDRKSTASMVHHKIMMIFKFLNLKGFKEMHKYRNIVESMEIVDLEKYYINTYSKIYLGKPEVVEINPMNIMEIESNLTIPVDKKRSICKYLFELWHKWECETKDMLKDCLNKLEEDSCISDIKIIEEQIEHVMHEIKCIKKYIIELNDVDWCIKHIYSMQEEIDDEYEEKLEEYFEDN